MKPPLIFISVFLLIACSNEQFYSPENYEKIIKIDSHVHLYTNRDAYVQCALKDGFKLLTIVDDHLNTFAYVNDHYVNAIEQIKNHAEVVQFATTFTMEGWDEPGWTSRTKDWLGNSFKDGAIAVKVWKNIGMAYKNKEGKLIMIDDPKFDSVFSMLADKKIPVIAHLGEPKNCWLPLEEMTTKGNQSYFKNNPQYHMYLHPEFPSYEEQIAARDRMIEKNPDLKVIGAHLGSQEWSVEELGKSLDKHPNMAVDLSARMDQLYYQTNLDREKVRNFFIKYQDRLIYGTDTGDKGTGEEEQLYRRMHEKWYADWLYFVTENDLKSNGIDKDFKGLKLPKQVVDKIYRINFSKWIYVF